MEIWTCFSFTKSLSCLYGTVPSISNALIVKHFRRRDIIYVTSLSLITHWFFSTCSPTSTSETITVGILSLNYMSEMGAPFLSVKQAERWASSTANISLLSSCCSIFILIRTRDQDQRFAYQSTNVISPLCVNLMHYAGVSGLAVVF